MKELIAGRASTQKVLNRRKQGYEMEETRPATQAEQTGEVRKRLLSNILKLKVKGTVS